MDNIININTRDEDKDEKARLISEGQDLAADLQAKARRMEMKRANGGKASKQDIDNLVAGILKCNENMKAIKEKSRIKDAITLEDMAERFEDE